MRMIQENSYPAEFIPHNGRFSVISLLWTKIPILQQGGVLSLRTSLILKLNDR